MFYDDTFVDDTQVYETNEYGFSTIKKFENFVDDKIGVETEINEVETGVYYMIVYGLTQIEVEMLRDFENFEIPRILKEMEKK